MRRWRGRGTCSDPFLLRRSFSYQLCIVIAVLLWTAPEHILERKKGLFAGSQAGDVYGYGIILNEVFTRNEPFEYLRTLVPIQGKSRDPWVRYHRQPMYNSSIYHLCNVMLRYDIPRVPRCSFCRFVDASHTIPFTHRFFLPIIHSSIHQLCNPSHLSLPPSIYFISLQPILPLSFITINIHCFHYFYKFFYF